MNKIGCIPLSMIEENMKKEDKSKNEVVIEVKEGKG